MSRKPRPDYDIDALFEGIDSNPPPPSTGGATTKAPLSSSTTTTQSKPPNLKQGKSEKDLLAELDSLAVERPTSISRPNTPRIRGHAANASPRHSLERSRSTQGTRNSGEGYGIGTGTPVGRSSGEYGPKAHTPIEAPAVNITSPSGDTTSGGASGGGWWGGIWSTASAAVKTAEGVYKELQQSEETKKWTSQVKGNVDVLQKLGGELRSRAIPTFTTILHTIAPPISSHEQLRIHITHDILNYPSVDTIVYGVFDRVMQQVEGGDLMVIQRGGESKPRRSGGSSFNAGPWYKGPETRDLKACIGFGEGAKLAKAAAESYAREYLAAYPPTDDNSGLNPDNPTRQSNIFLAIQPSLYSNPLHHLTHETSSTTDPSNVSDPDDTPETLVTFSLYLHDPLHNISFSTMSQSLPAKWLEWIDSSSGGQVPEDIAQLIYSGGIDPRDWVVEWVEETLGLAVGIVAQRYVAKRMHVGEVGAGEKGKGVEGEIEARRPGDAAVGEEARAGVM